MPLKDYQKKAQKAYRDRQHKVAVNFDKEKDAELLAALRNMAEDDKELPGLIKELLAELLLNNAGGK